MLGNKTILVLPFFLAVLYNRSWKTSSILLNPLFFPIPKHNQNTTFVGLQEETNWMVFINRNLFLYSVLFSKIEPSRLEEYDVLAQHDPITLRVSYNTAR